jgi:hypothetical protein
MTNKFQAASFHSYQLQQRLLWLALWGLWFLLGGCRAGAPIAVATATPPMIDNPAWQQLFFDHVTEEEAVTALIIAERQATIQRDLALLGQLWAEDAQIVDGRNTSTINDDYRWQGRAALLDRYQVAVFPFDLPPLTVLAADALITIRGDSATVLHGNDQWQLVKADQRWWLAELRYATPANK